MLKKTLIGTVAAGFVAAGGLAATPASAAGVYFNGPNFSVGIQGPGPGPRFMPQPHRDCQPVYQTVKWWKFGHFHTAVVKVGENCYWTGGPGPGPFPGQYSAQWNKGYPGQWNGGYPGQWNNHPW